MKPTYRILVTAMILSLHNGCDHSHKNGEDHTHVADTVMSTREKFDNLARHSGEYLVLNPNSKPGDHEEVYRLRKDGSAQWMVLVNDGDGGAHISNQKDGIWVARPNELRIELGDSLQNKTEVYQLKDSTFRESREGKRYLKKTL